MDVRETRKIAELARLALRDDELARFASQLTAILGYFEKLSEIETQGVPPASHPRDLRGPLRPDAAQPDGDPARLVALSANGEAGFYRVPRVLE